MFEFLLLIIIERGGEDKRIYGFGGFEVLGEKVFELWGRGWEKNYFCDRKRKGREKNLGRYSRNWDKWRDRGRIKEKGREEVSGKGERSCGRDKIGGVGGDERRIKIGDLEIGWWS